MPVASFLRRRGVISVNKAFKSGHLPLLGGAARGRSVVSHLKRTLGIDCGEAVVVGVMCSDLFELTLLIGGLRLNSGCHWVLHRADTSYSLMILRREHYVILIQWHLRSQWVSHIQIREMGGFKSLLMVLLLMWHETYEIFWIMTHSMKRIVSKGLLLNCKQCRYLSLQLSKIVSDI